ncbi:hypothetical protein EON65_48365 [archaeon]|nr:MAG: hypothetical protein EON65_48365 [archaeon]
MNCGGRGGLSGVKITLKPFPLSTVGNPGSEEEGWGEDVRVRASPFYLSEVTSNPKGEVVSVRVQDAVSVEGAGGEEEGDGQSWRDLPTPLHLDILQLLQMPPSCSEAGGQLTLKELWDAIQMLHGEEEGRSAVDVVPWGEVYSALRWLYYRGLVVIQSDEGGLWDDEVSAEEFLKLFSSGTEVVDLRSVTKT